jgi:protein TonB
MAMQTDSTEIRTLSLFILISLLLHALLLILPTPKGPTPSAKEPVYVEIQPPPSIDQPSRELDLPVQPDQERTKPAKRLGPSDRVVEKETAPKGDAPEDRLPAVTVPVPPTPQPEQPKQPKPVDDGLTPAKLPDLKTLTALPKETQVRIGEELWVKERADVAEGEAIWLDTEKDILISFFQRLRNGIYQNWNYPGTSLERGEQGASLIEMIFDREGKVLDVILLRSSGFPLLDREAIAAVLKGDGSYGALPKAYPKEQLRIKAFFNYNLERRPTMFGQQ